MNAKISVFLICVKAIIYLLLYNLHDCTFNYHSVVLGKKAEIPLVTLWRRLIFMTCLIDITKKDKLYYLRNVGKHETSLGKPSFQGLEKFLHSRTTIPCHAA